MPSPESHDVAIVGAGLAGLTAGARLAERGVRVVVLEKGGDEGYPCNVRISGGVFHICFRHINDDEASAPGDDQAQHPGLRPGRSGVGRREAHARGRALVQGQGRALRERAAQKRFAR